MTAVGEGPGHLTPDGCAVDLYAVMPAGREPELIASAVPAGAELLELGAGAGRVTEPLLRDGFRVVAVDESAEMLAHIDGAETVVARIEGLELGRRFDAVLLCSHLINTPDHVQRHAFLSAAVGHVHAEGCVVIERHPPGWFDAAVDSSAVIGGVEVGLVGISRPRPGLLAATVEYRLDERLWRHSFVAERVDDDALDELLGRHGLVVDRFLDAEHSWIRAVPSQEREG